MVYSEFNNAHLKAFQESLSDDLDPNEARGKRGRAFADKLGCDVSSALPEEQLKRGYVFTLAKAENVNITTVCAAIMAWGGMHYNHRDLLFDSKNEDWLSIASEIRCGRLDREKAYESFAKLRKQGKLKGMGPAYFTKLIYFLMPRSSTTTKLGYIMDQWVGCSINLLTDQETVFMNVQKTWKSIEKVPEPKYLFTVSDVNTGANYKNFCRAMDSLVNHLGRKVKVCQVDRALHSNDGKSWRNYVNENRTKTIYNDAK